MTDIQEKDERANEQCANADCGHRCKDHRADGACKEMYCRCNEFVTEGADLDTPFHDETVACDHPHCPMCAPWVAAVGEQIEATYEPPAGAVQEDERERLAGVLDGIAADHFRCECTVEYTSRNLTDPLCDAHDGVQDDLAKAATLLRSHVPVPTVQQEPDAWLVRYTDARGRVRRIEGDDGTFWSNEQAARKRAANFATDTGLSVTVDPVFINPPLYRSTPVAGPTWGQQLAALSDEEVCEIVGYDDIGTLSADSVAHVANRARRDFSRMFRKLFDRTAREEA